MNESSYFPKGHAGDCKEKKEMLRIAPIIPNCLVSWPNCHQKSLISTVRSRTVVPLSWVLIHLRMAQERCNLAKLQKGMG